uniref:Uncharacterized protein n=1 Tax=Arundo donax TaxID=35708 RepID=A0A0A9HK14_ARUDO
MSSCTHRMNTSKDQGGCSEEYTHRTIRQCHRMKRRSIITEWGVNFGQLRLCSPDDPTMVSDKVLEYWLGNGHIGVVGKLKSPNYPTMRKS